MALPYLFRAALHRHFDGVRGEIEKSTDVNQKHNGFGILHLLPYAGGFGRSGVGSPVDPAGKSGIDLMSEETLEICRIFLEAGVDPNAVDGWNRNGLFMPCYYADRNGPRGHKFNKMVDLIMDYGGDPNMEDNWGSTPALMAVASGDMTAVRRVFTNEDGVDDIQADINKQTDYRGITPLIQSVKSGNLEIVQFILTLQPDLTLKDRWHDKTAKEIAQKNGRQDIVDAIELFGEMTMPDGDEIPITDPLTVTTEDQS